MPGYVCIHPERASATQSLQRQRGIILSCFFILGSVVVKFKGHISFMTQVFQNRIVSERLGTVRVNKQTGRVDIPA